MSSRNTSNPRRPVYRFWMGSFRKFVYFLITTIFGLCSKILYLHYSVLHRLGDGLAQYELHQVEVPLVGNTECRHLLGSNQIDDTMVCAGDVDNGGLDTCQVCVKRGSTRTS